MLSPNVVETGENIAGAYNQMRAVGGFAHAAINTTVSPLSPDPIWLPPLRQRMADLRDAGQGWENLSPAVTVAYFAPFIDYATTFASVAETAADPALKTDQLLDLLSALQDALTENRGKVRAAEKQFTDYLGRIKTVETQLDQSLQTAWSELASEEQQMIRLAQAITSLQDRVAQLQDNLTSAEISSGKSYFQTAATISYTLVTAAEIEIPYLSIASEIYTIGKMAYDLIVTDKEIDEAIGEIVKLRIEATEAAQAAAMSKAVIRMINNFDKQMAALAPHLPAIDQMWETEAGKVASTIDAINKGADPKTLLDVVSLKPAAASWGELSRLAQACMTYPVKTGTPVTISTDQSLHKAIA